MRPAQTRWLILAALAAFFPLYWFIFVVGGVLPYGAILLLTLHNLSNGWMLLWNGLNLVIYGAALYGFAGVLAALIQRREAGQRPVAAGALLLMLAGVALLPIFGAGHGTVERMNAYQLYASGKAR